MNKAPFKVINIFSVEKTHHEASSPDGRPHSAFYDDLPFRGYKRPPTQVPHFF